MNSRLLIGLIFIFGCASLPQDDLEADLSSRVKLASRAKTELIGMSKKDLFTCAGVPAQQERLDDVEFLTYTGRGDSVGAGYVNPHGFMIYKRYHRYCKATFILKNGKVEKINYEGRAGHLDSGDEQCGFIVENCLSKK